jgi:hypothetical protein
MKHLILISTIFILFTTFTGCIAYHNGVLSNSGLLISNNFKYVKTDVSGSAKATYVMGIGGVKRQALVADAKKDMMLNNSLKANQALVNTTVNFKNSFFFGFIVVTTTCVVSADIIEFVPSIYNSSQISNQNNDVPNNNIPDNQQNNNITNHSYDQSVAANLSGNEKTIYLAKSKENLTLTNYPGIKSVKHGDVVKFIDKDNSSQFGIVEYIFMAENKIGVSYYNDNHVKVLLKFSLSEIQKLE